MKRAVCLFAALGITLNILAAQYPPEWVKYTYGGYMYDIQSARNDRNLPETEFKTRLLDNARTALARQVEMRVQDIAELSKQSVDGRASIAYTSNTRFATNVNLKLVQTCSEYDRTSNTGFAIAYIDKEAALNYYRNELLLLFNRVCNGQVLADDFTEAGFKSKAQSELERALKHFESMDEPLLWLNTFGASPAYLTEWQEKFNIEEQKIKRKLAELKHGTVICLTCKADLFGAPYRQLQNELKGILAADGCSFTENADDADWSIDVICTTREYSNRPVGNIPMFVAYVDASITICKTKTRQRIFEDGLSEKGAHTLSYNEAARAAYKEIKRQIGSILTNNLKQ